MVFHVTFSINMTKKNKPLNVIEFWRQFNGNVNTWATHAVDRIRMHSNNVLKSELCHYLECKWCLWGHVYFVCIEWCQIASLLSIISFQFWKIISMITLLPCPYNSMWSSFAHLNLTNVSKVATDIQFGIDELFADYCFNSRPVDLHVTNNLPFIRPSVIPPVPLSHYSLLLHLLHFSFSECLVILSQMSAWNIVIDIVMVRGYLTSIVNW